MAVVVGSELTSQVGASKSRRDAFKVRQGVGMGGCLLGGAAPASSNRDFESLDFLLPTQLNSSHKRSVIFVEALLEADPFPREVFLL